ncbi:MAG: excinuclease ABC subunit UvrA [Candidatus Moranbacteria bacterium]|nr:excinuclease ABC subunit UvrA [Candidatus Moranbacteria bacterium]
MVSSRSEKFIVVKGAREHNLKNVSIEIPRDAFVVFTGLSGSGKSTLAFDTIFAEGQRRYLESLSSYARQFLGQMDKPDVDSIEGLSPAIAIDQKSTSHNPRSTVGTVTEVHDYLRLLWAKTGVSHCSVCGREISALSIDEIVERIFDRHHDETVDVLAPVVRGRKGTYIKMLDDLYHRGFVRVRIDGVEHSLSGKNTIDLARNKKHSIDVVVDSVLVSESKMTRLFDAVESALRLTNGLLGILSSSSRDTKIPSVALFHQRRACPVHDEQEIPELEPRLFSFNSPFGACPACEGLGVKKEIDPSLIAPDWNKTIAQGGLLPWSSRKNTYQNGILRAVLQHYHIKDNVRLRDLSERHRDILFHGVVDGEDIDVKLRSKTGSMWKFTVDWRGIVVFLEERYRKTDSDSVRRDIEAYMAQKSCGACKGARFRSEALSVTVSGKGIADVSHMTIDDAVLFFDSMTLSKNNKLIADRILKEVVARLGFLHNVGLGYLSLDRAAHTLSGGEAQRIRLASQLGAQLVGVLYILDEPSIGLHAKDNTKLLETLLALRDRGNTVIVIEHDEETMRAADFLVDVGPRAGVHGGRIVVSGVPEKVFSHPDSLTGKYLRGELVVAPEVVRRSTNKRKSIVVRGASEHNLKNVTVNFPLKSFTCVTGVSGSGKSTLVEDILYKTLANKVMRSMDRPGKHKEILGIEYIDKVIMIDQAPIGRTPRSNPATYTGVFTPIRTLFSETKDAKERGYKPGRFSFNVSGGRCENCQGDGSLKIEMQFMPDVYLPCDVCGGKRYNAETLRVLYKGKTISDVLDMTVTEACEFFEPYREIYTKIKTLDDVGLGYIRLGQSATTLSGGEAQRVKLATELARRATGDTFYVLDEPTTGLHFDDVRRLLEVLHRLVNAGNTVVVIEHNLDVIKSADWVVDMGPDGGAGGGKVVVSGTPEDVAKHSSSYTGQYLRHVL